MHDYALNISFYTMVSSIWFVINSTNSLQTTTFSMVAFCINRIFHFFRVFSHDSNNLNFWTIIIILRWFCSYYSLIGSTYDLRSIESFTALDIISLNRDFSVIWYLLAVFTKTHYRTEKSENYSILWTESTEKWKSNSSKHSYNESISEEENNLISVTFALQLLS